MFSNHTLSPDKSSDADFFNNILQWIRCPRCKSKLIETKNILKCPNELCNRKFSIISKIPILIDEERSIFTIQNIIERYQIFSAKPVESFFIKLSRKVTPSLSKNLKAQENYSKFAEYLHKIHPESKVLVIGGSIIGQGLTHILNHPKLTFIETDVAIGARTAVVCDAHALPFENSFFDGVIIQAVLEHVVDPHQCVDEIFRVLKNNGLVYAETPFMQQVHEGRYDFTRFTHLGHRRLFRKFKCISDGAVGGSGMALAWSLKYFFLSFSKSKNYRKIVDTLSNFLFFWLKYFDSFLINSPATLDAASGFFFLGQKDKNILMDTELIKLYRGAM